MLWTRKFVSTVTLAIPTAAAILSSCSQATPVATSVEGIDTEPPPPAPPPPQPPSEPTLPPGDLNAAEVVFEINAQRDRHPISPLVYGTNRAADLARAGNRLLRLGGNRYTAYNWENNASNAGDDWNSQNDGYLSTSNVPAQAVTDAFLQATLHDAAVLVTIPILDYVAADKASDGDVRESGSDYLRTRFRKNRAEKGAPFSELPDASDAYVNQDEFVHYLHEHKPKVPILFSLDNEPGLWSSTHEAIHPKPVTYAELWDRNQRFAIAIKKVWPEAPITGFVSYGWNGFVNLQNAPDNRNRDFIDWYLDQARAAEKGQGRRLIDYLDLHWYPEAKGGGKRVTGGDNSEAVAQARVQAPRSLWDPSYSETSWIRDALGEPIDLIHRIRSKIARHYPGTRLAFTEWDYGGGDHISGGLASADVLGVFGRFGVDLAAHWPGGKELPFVTAAFRVYLNYDNLGGHFGDTSIWAESSDVPTATVYASVDAESTNRMVIVAINKADSAKIAAVKIAPKHGYETASVFTLTAGQATLVAAPSISASEPDEFAYTMPPASVSVIVPIAGRTHPSAQSHSTL